MKKPGKSYTHRFVVLFSLVRLVLHTAQRMVYPFLPLFAGGLHVTVDTISFSLGFTALASILSPFLAPIADRSGRKMGMLLGAFLFTVGMGLMAVAPGQISFVVCMLVSTMGINLTIPSIHSYLSDITSYSSRGLVLAVTEIAWALAYLLGMPLIGILIDKSSWQAPFGVMTVLGLLVMLVLLFWVPAESRQPMRSGKHPFNLNVVFTSSMAWAALALGLAMVTANQVVNVFYSTWLVAEFQFQTVALGAVSIVIGFAELGGEGITAVVVDRLGKERSVLLGLVVNSAVAMLYWVMHGGLLPALVWLFLFFLTFEFTIVASLPLMTEVLPHVRATFLAFFIAACSLGRSLGAFVAPFLYPYGFFTLCLAAVVLNLFALFMLTRVKILATGRKQAAGKGIP
jgi:DHA1 family inner membrane transport protein